MIATANLAPGASAASGKFFRRPLDRPAPGLVLVLALLAAAAAGACGGEVDAGEAGQAVGAAWPARPNLILISLDTLRRDRVTAYGEPVGGAADRPPTTPELDRFAARALRFDRAYTHQAWTLTAHMTMLTSLYPSVHGLAPERRLSPEARTLAEVVRAAGYDTFAVVDPCPWIAPEFGFDRGFRDYAVVDAGAARKVAEVLARVDAARPPFFAFAHFFAAHSAWGGGLPYGSEPRDQAAYAGWYGGDFDGEDEELGLGASELLMHWNETDHVPDEAERAFVAALYDAGVRSLDRQLGRLFAGFEERGLFANSVILVTADHGEELWEHGRALHGQAFDECLRIPFLLRTPETRGGATDQLVALVDVMPTLLDLAGVPAPFVQGRSVAPLARGEELDDAKRWIRLDPSFLLGFHDAERALIWSRDGLAYFDLGEDPEQAHDLLDAEGGLAGAPVEVRDALETVRREWERMEPLRERFAPTEGPALEADAREHLRGLGYLGDSDD